MILSATPASTVSPEFMGMLVIGLIQISQLVFAYRKDQARGEAAKKEDLAALRKELKAEIAEVAQKAEKVRDGLSNELKEMSHESEIARAAIYKELGGVALQAASLIKGQEHTDQSLAALALKLDNVLFRTRRTR